MCSLLMNDELPLSCLQILQKRSIFLIIYEVAYLAMNKGGTMKSLFHPYVEGFLLRGWNKAFIFLSNPGIFMKIKVNLDLVDRVNSLVDTIYDLVDKTAWLVDRLGFSGQKAVSIKNGHVLKRDLWLSK